MYVCIHTYTLTNSYKGYVYARRVLSEPLRTPLHICIHVCMITHTQAFIEPIPDVCGGPLAFSVQVHRRGDKVALLQEKVCGLYAHAHVQIFIHLCAYMLVHTRTA